MKASRSMFELSNDRGTLLGSFVSRSLSAIAILLTFGCWYAHVAFNCQGTLTQAQCAGFEQMFAPPYSLSLVNTGAAGDARVLPRLMAISRGHIGGHTVEMPIRIREREGRAKSQLLHISDEAISGRVKTEPFTERAFRVRGQ
jgi:hypothetical protein